MGLMIAIGGSVAVLVYPPYSFLGNLHWGFAWGNIYTLFGNTLPIYKHIDISTLLMELVLVNVVGFGLRYTAKTAQKRAQRPPVRKKALPRRPR
ncbi:MAG: hypothetical protein OEW08_09550 [Gammaproteobacteria bacterium]|nr:hypothetical protein [Gammaproteobacteria bacterium]